MARLAGVALVLMAAVTGCALDDNTDGSHRPLTEAVRAAAASGETIRLADVTDFEWDVAHVIPPYASDREVADTLGVDWEPKGTDIEASEGAHLLVFVDGDQVVRAFEQADPDAYLACLGRRTIGPEGLRAATPLRTSRADGDFPLLSLARPEPGRQARRTERCVRAHT